MGRNFCWILLLSLATSAQQAVGQGEPLPPTLTGIFPPSANVGLSTWAIYGRNLNRARTLSVSGSGVEVRSFEARSDNEGVATVLVSGVAAPGIREVRVDGPDGVSNLLLVRVEPLRLMIETEPNDRAAAATEVAVGSALAGVLKPQDVDFARVKGEPGQRVTLDLVARRLGMAISPVLTVTDARGHAILQARESLGVERDARASVVLPADGVAIVEVRDNIYGGSDRTGYLLRVDPDPFATGMFPLAIPAGKESDVSVLGGSLTAPIVRKIKAAGTPGGWIALGSFGEISPTGRVLIAGPDDLTEGPTASDGISAPELRPGLAVDGRLSAPDEVDRYRLRGKQGDRIRLQVHATRLGSWLDSVLTVKNAKGETVAENDDLGDANRVRRQQGVNNQGLQELPPDSVVDLTLPEDGVFTVEVADRFGAGGPEYAYRLAVGQPRPDFKVTMLLGNPAAGQQVQGLRKAANVRLPTGYMGVFNVKPGETVAVDFLVTPEGRPGPIEIRAEGLPEGVTADPVTVKFPNGPSTSTTPLDPTADRIVLKVTKFAAPGLSQWRLVATAKPAGLPPIVHHGEAVIGLDPSNLAGGARPVTRTIDAFPLRVKGETRRMFVGPPGPPLLLPIMVAGPLLQGDTMNLVLRFDPPIQDPESVRFQAEAIGEGVAASTVVTTDVSRADDEGGGTDLQVRLKASPDSKPGPRSVRLEVRPGKGKVYRLIVPIQVKVPIELTVASGTVGIATGKSVGLPVKVKRLPGCEAEVELKAEDLPPGIRQVGEAIVEPEMDSATIRLELAPGPPGPPKDGSFQIGAVVHMPGGRVRVVSPIRPILRRIAADEKGETGSNNGVGAGVQP